MIEITNTQLSPITVVVRSRRRLRSFTTLLIPGRGSGKNRVRIADEAITDVIRMVEDKGLITTRFIEE